MLIGIDEVGRGAWAGPLCVCAVGIGNATISGLTDSKMLTSKRRRELALRIREVAPLIGIGWVHARDIDLYGLSTALRVATAQALAQVDSAQIEQIIIDGTVNFIDDPRVTTMKQADLIVPSVSAASIIAKVARDQYMESLDTLFAGYGFAKNVGYGTKSHMAGLQSHGPSVAHRHSFKPISAHNAALKSIKTNSVTVGAQAEESAARHLNKLGFTILFRNWKTKVCEIDIIAKKAERVYFVEVKYRKTNAQGGGIAAITSKKLRQMKFAASVWMKAHGTVEAQLAVIEVSGQDFQITEFIESVQL